MGDGEWTYVPTQRTLRWSLPRPPRAAPRRAQTLQGTFASVDVHPCPARAAQVSFVLLPGVLLSALKVDQLKLSGETYKPYKGVRAWAFGRVEWRVEWKGGYDDAYLHSFFACDSTLACLECPSNLVFHSGLSRALAIHISSPSGLKLKTGPVSTREPAKPCLARHLTGSARPSSVNHAHGSAQSGMSTGPADAARLQLSSAQGAAATLDQREGSGNGGEMQTKQ